MEKIPPPQPTSRNLLCSEAVIFWEVVGELREPRISSFNHDTDILREG